MAIEGNCDVHDWSWDPIDDYGCPVCYGMSIERERIRAHITARIEELRSCNKDDDCAKIADYIESYLPEWVWE
jgi:hypothetical protein